MHIVSQGQHAKAQEKEPILASHINWHMSNSFLSWSSRLPYVPTCLVQAHRQNGRTENWPLRASSFCRAVTELVMGSAFPPSPQSPSQDSQKLRFQGLTTILETLWVRQAFVGSPRSPADINYILSMDNLLSLLVKTKLALLIILFINGLVYKRNCELKTNKFYKPKLGKRI